MVHLNKVIIGNECYPNNERILKVSELNIHDGDDIYVDFKYLTDIDISILIFVKKYIDDKFPRSNKYLNMLYVPYSRMDREIDGYMFSLKYFCDLINWLEWDCVFILDNHSKVIHNYINSCYEYSAIEYATKAYYESGCDFIFLPDKGAKDRYYAKLFYDGQNSNAPKIKHKGNKISVLFGNKERDLNTGKIIKFSIEDTVYDIVGKDVLIVDDLCAFGGTFLASAQSLKDKGANNVDLYITHCEESIFKGKVLTSDLIRNVYTTHSILNDSHKKIRFVD